MNLNIPPISSIKLWRRGYGLEHGMVGPKTVTDPIKLAKIRGLLNSELKEEVFMPWDPEAPVFFVQIFPEDSNNSIVLEFNAAMFIMKGEDDLFVYSPDDNPSPIELWDLLEIEMFGELKWSVNMVYDPVQKKLVTPA